MKAVIAVDDEGTRLRPLTCTLPVANLEILGEPLLFSVLNKLLSLNVSEIILVLNYKASSIEAMFPNNEYKGIPVSFVTEENDFGSAGNVKNALADETETILVINGDIYFDFDLNDACNRHISNKNDVTIICKETEDPREYSVVELSENGDVSEFIEKPAWAKVTGNMVDCGIYLLEPFVLKEIPEDRSYDFGKDFFPSLLLQKFKIGSFVALGYWRKICDVENYKAVQFDIINGKVNKKIPFVAEGIFTKSTIPHGNFVIVPPVYFGENVQIESGAVIGPFTVIGDGSLVSKGSKIRESVLFKSVYVSSGCSVNGALLAEGVSVKKGASLFERCVIGQESVIGEESVITNDVLVWPNKTIENGVTVNENVKYSSPTNNAIQFNDMIFGDFGVELTPEKTARLGAAIGTLFDGVRVGVGIDGETNSLALKCGLLGGLISVGAKSFDFSECFYSQIFYYSAFCDVDVAVFINGGENGVSLSFCEKGGLSLSGEKLRKLETILKHNEFNRCSGGDCQSVSVIKDIDNMYLGEITRQFGETEINLQGVLFCCGNKILTACVSKTFERLGISSENEDFIVKINNIGTKITVVENSVSFSHEKILAIVAYNEMKKGNDVALPWDAPQIITALGNSLGRKTYRVMSSDVFSAEGIKPKNSEIEQLWSRDAVLLMFKLLKLMSVEQKSVKALSEELPEFYVAKKVMQIDVSPSVISKTLLQNDFKTDENGSVSMKNKKGFVRVKSDESGKKLRIITEAVNAELAEELCGETQKLISIDIDL